ncbi:KxYKxGKxW signal peptide domain-containing protein [Enterococcus hermanniensis]|uniref:Gram-positive cocci surface proteins LPxTG domain-containing protein n=1 Tax=Enterococcus hermanniensis TaxID=249189 RepID=A0A1L8TJJ0_9ENTE|nr:KxYKxGKxW signal peptide domain-containing protein [Enterococcus hermanniensis]OJG44373.1 hypothetical protein RV04_GL000567 [Enterococcus hermanniensis]
MKKIKKIEITETTRKEHIKMWKSKKNWVCGAVVLFSSTVLLSVANENVRAAEVDNSSVAAAVVAQEAQKSNGYHDGQLASSIGQAIANQATQEAQTTSTEVSNQATAAAVVAQEAQKSNGYHDGQLASSIGQAFAKKEAQTTTIADTPNKSTEASNQATAAAVVAQEAQKSNGYHDGQLASSIGQAFARRVLAMDAKASNNEIADLDNTSKVTNADKVTITADNTATKTVKSIVTEAKNPTNQKITTSFASYKPAISAKVIATTNEKAEIVTPAVATASITSAAETAKNEIPKFGSKENTALIAIGMVSVAGALTGLALETESRKRRS